MKRGRFIGIDFDDTFTADPELWLEFIRLAKERGHQVFCVTARGDAHHEEVRNAMPAHVEIILTNGKKKQAVSLEHGVDIDIWIDDSPWMIADAD